METTKAKILLIEDDTFLARMYKSKLNTENFEVLVAYDGEKGYAMALNDSPTAILLDIVLPKMDGYQVLKKLKDSEKTRYIPVILLTNLGQKDDIDRGLALGAKDYLIKAHFTPTEVVDKIKKVIEQG